MYACMYVCMYVFMAWFSAEVVDREVVEPGGCWSEKLVIVIVVVIAQLCPMKFVISGPTIMQRFSFCSDGIRNTQYLVKSNIIIHLQWQCMHEMILSPTILFMLCCVVVQLCIEHSKDYIQCWQCWHFIHCFPALCLQWIAGPILAGQQKQ